MKIIKRGTLPSERQDWEYAFRCSNCFTTFECFQKEGELIYYDILKANCPICDHRCMGNLKPEFRGLK